jgi:hypothetical protein
MSLRSKWNSLAFGVSGSGAVCESTVVLRLRTHTRCIGSSMEELETSRTLQNVERQTSIVGRGCGFRLEFVND